MTGNNDIRDQFSSMIAGIEEKVAQFQRDIFYSLSYSAIYANPVDTGYSRGSWIASLDEFNPTVFEKPTKRNLDPGDRLRAGEEAAQQALGSVLAAIAQHRPGQDLMLANNADYINHLDQGTSKIQAYGMSIEAVNTFNSFREKLID